MKTMKHLAILLAAAVLISLLCLPAAAAPHYSGELLTDTDTDNQIWLSDSMWYNTEKRLFTYPVSDTGQVVEADVADGMVVTSTVHIYGSSLLAYRNGRLFDGNLKELSTPGEYVIMAQVGNQSLRMFSFILAGTTTADLSAYNVPAGMYVTNATRDGEEISFDRYTVPMQEDGQYHIEYECVSTGIGYALDLTVDRTPPELQFSGSIDERNRVHSALSISGIEEGGSVRVTLDGVVLDVEPNADGTLVLPDSGAYRIEAFDAAGNRSEYGYTVLLYLNASSLVFFILLLGSVAAVIIYVFVKRKKLKIG